MVKNAWKRVLAFMLAFAMVVCDAGVSSLVYADTEETGETDTTGTGEGEDSTTLTPEEYLKQELTEAWTAGLSYVELEEDYGITTDLVDEMYEDLLTYEYEWFYVYETKMCKGPDRDSDGEIDVVTGIYITYGLEDGFYGTDRDHTVATDEDGNPVVDEDGNTVYVMNNLTDDQLGRIAEMLGEIEAAIGVVTSAADSNWCAVEKALYLNDYLAETCQYDENAYEADNTEERNKFTIYGALVENLCVCEGYARTFVILAKELGLNAELVRSYSLGHEWNAVEIDGEWYMLDVTWDDPVKNKRSTSEDGSQVNDIIGRAYHTYFLKSIDYFCATDKDYTVHMAKVADENGNALKDEDGNYVYEKDWTYTGSLTDGDFTANTYDTAIWDDVRNPYAYDGAEFWYTVDTEGNILKCSFSSSGATETTLTIISDKWLQYYEVSGNSITYYYYDECFSSLGLYDGVLYYTTPDTIYTYDVDTGESTYYYGLTDAQLEDGYIYGMQISSSGMLSIQLAESDGEVGTIFADFLDLNEDRDSVEDATITLSSTSYTYDGNAKTPTVTVKYGSTTLKADTDYRIEYNNNTDAGTATVTITGIGNYNGTVIKEYTIKKANLTGVISTLSMTYGQSRTPYSAYGSYSLTTSYNYSANESIAKITNGTIEATGVGTTTIYYYVGMDNYEYIEMTVTVSKADQTISNVGNVSMTYGQTTTLSATTTGNGTISYSSSNTGVVTVNSSTGQITTVSSGSAVITVTAAGTSNYNSATKTITVTVSKAAQTLSRKTSGSTNIYVGGTTTWTAQTTGDGSITYSTSDSSIATVDSTGKVTAKKVGSVSIYAVANSSSKYNASSKVTLANIIVAPAATSSVTLSNVAKGVTISWSQVTGASGYYVYRSTSQNSGYSAIAQLTSGSTLTYTNTSPSSGTTYYYKVVAYYNVNSSSMVLGAESSVKSIKYLKQGTVSSLTNTSSGVKVAWKKVTGASGYYIYRGSKKVKTITKGSTTSWTDTGVKSKNGTSYTYYVVPYSGSTKGAKSSGLKTVRLTAVTLSSVKNTSSKAITVKYKKNSKATGYQIQYSTSKTFAKGNKTVKVTSKSTLSKKITKLTKKKTYYVRVRAYKTSSGKTYYSAWSSTKSVKITK